MKHSLKVFTLGRLNIELNGESLSDFVSQKAPALFVYLLHNPREHERSVLAESFWNDTSSEQALKNLRTVLSNLQKNLGDYLDVSRQTISVTKEAEIWLDSREFRKRLSKIHDLHSRPYSPRRLLREVDNALALYEGDFLPSLKAGNAPDLDTWVTLERESLRTGAMKILFLGMEMAMAQGEYQQGILYGQHLMALDSLYEKGLRLLMQLHSLNDNRNAALQAYDSFAKMLRKELSVEPEDETISLSKMIRLGRIEAKPIPKIPHNLQSPINRYTGNEEAIKQAHHLLDKAECRLLTLLGVGGIGKTRMAEHIAQERLEDYRDGVYFVPLTAVSNPDDVTQMILQTLGILYNDSRRKPIDILVEALREKHLLLILDNFEHVLEAADTVSEILRRAPYLQILVTSREQLKLQNEYLIALESLDYPKESTSEKPHSALALFAQMAERVQAGFSLQENLSSVVEICRLVDGLPLAIVIAAAWVQFLKPDLIAQKIQESLDFLRLERRDIPERHRGISALLHSTWQNLNEKEQAHLSALAIFLGDFDKAAAMAISGASEADLDALQAKSLIQLREDGRYQQHELLRRFVLEQGENHAARMALAQYFRNWAANLFAEGKPIHEQFALIDREYKHLWRLDGLSEEEQHRHILLLCDILPEYWIARGYPVDEGIRRLDEALDFAESREQYVRALVRLGQMFSQSEQLDAAQAILPGAIELSHELGDRLLEGIALNEYQRSLMFSGHFEKSRDYLFQLVDLCEHSDNANSPQMQRLRGIAYTNLGTIHNQLGFMEEAKLFAQLGIEVNTATNNILMLCLCHNVLGIVALDDEDYPKAESEFAKALELAKKVGHVRFETMFSGNLAEAVQKNGDFDAAYKIYLDTLITAAKIENYSTVLNVLEQMANLTLELEIAEKGAVLWGAAKQLREHLQIAIEPRQLPELDGIELGLKMALGEETFFATVSKGRNLSIVEAISFAKQV